MCGICGFVGPDPALTRDVLERMNGALWRRGPDDEGISFEPGIGLAMRRLSIIDPAGGHQPIAAEDEDVRGVFNCEIYNYRELRHELQQRGHAFRTGSDAEVIIHLYQEYGPELVHRLQGMFAFALWDAPRRRLVVARDRLGIKPLFYAQLGDTVIFGSEIKALIASGLVPTDIDPQALDAYFAYTYVPAPLTIYSAIRKLEPGCLLTVESGAVRCCRYWDLDMSVQDEAPDEREWAGRFEDAIRSTVQSHLMSDVPVGAFLSGGIDSSLVVALMSGHLKDPVSTFTMGLGGTSGLIDERPLAARVAERYGCFHHEQVVQPDLPSIVGDVVSAFDEPFADDSVIPSYYVAQFASRRVKVALSGLGGDELFAGYRRYSGVLLGESYARLMPAALHAQVVRPLVHALPESPQGGDQVDHLKRFASSALHSPAERYLGFVTALSSRRRGQLYAPSLRARIDRAATDRLITEPFDNCRAPDNISRALYVDMKTFLPEDILALSDRLSMWHSLELRVPLADHNLVELSARLPARFKINWREKKRLLRSIAQKHLPAAILGHRKQGFESPMAAWLRTDLSGYARDVLGPERLGAHGLFDQAVVDGWLADHLCGRRKNNRALFSLIMFQEWYERSRS